MVLAYYGHETDEVSLTMLCGTNVFGTSLSEIAGAARQLGFNASAAGSVGIATLQEAIDQAIPPIVLIDAGILTGKDDLRGFKHMIVIVGLDAMSVSYHDPQFGESRSVSVELFGEAWEAMRKGVVKIWR